jgi:hypothetical protein
MKNKTKPKSLVSKVICFANKGVFSACFAGFVFSLFLGFETWASPVHKQVVFLSGIDNEHTVDWDFFCTSGRKSGYWTKIKVPSHWEQQGFGEYDYGRDYRTYGKKFKFSDETGIYKH